MNIGSFTIIAYAKARGFKVSHLYEFTDNTAAELLDIRAPADFKAGRVIGAKNIPFADLTKRMSELEKHKDKPIIIICKTGQTASSAANMLKKADYTNVHRMSGGMAEWTGQNLPLVRK